MELLAFVLFLIALWAVFSVAGACLDTCKAARDTGGVPRVLGALTALGWALGGGYYVGKEVLGLSEMGAVMLWTLGLTAGAVVATVMSGPPADRKTEQETRSGVLPS